MVEAQAVSLFNVWNGDGTHLGAEQHTADLAQAVLIKNCRVQGGSNWRAGVTEVQGLGAGASLRRPRQNWRLFSWLAGWLGLSWPAVRSPGSMHVQHFAHSSI